MHSAVAHVQAINDGIAQWPAALDNSPAHATNAASYLANVRSSFDLQITRAPLLAEWLGPFSFLMDR